MVLKYAPESPSVFCSREMTLRCISILSFTWVLVIACRVQKSATTHSTAHSVTMPGASRRRRLPAPLCLEKMEQVMEELGNGQIACVRSCLKCWQVCSPYLVFSQILYMYLV